jgi:hypothetical protein
MGRHPPGSRPRRAEEADSPTAPIASGGRSDATPIATFVVEIVVGRTVATDRLHHGCGRPGLAATTASSAHIADLYRARGRRPSVLHLRLMDHPDEWVRRPGRALADEVCRLDRGLHNAPGSPRLPHWQQPGSSSRCQRIHSRSEHRGAGRSSPRAVDRRRERRPSEARLGRRDGYWLGRWTAVRLSASRARGTVRLRKSRR